MKPLLLQPSLYSILHVFIFLLLLRLIFSFKSLLYLLSRLWRYLEDQTQAYQYFSIPRFSSNGFHENHLMALSGVLNFMDGVFSCCGEERVMVVTMMAPPKDSAVLRPGRVDVHVHFPLCDFGAFKTLASSYLGLKDHKLYPQVEEVFQSGARLSPAEVGEVMRANQASPSSALKSVINTLQQSSSCSSSAVTSGRLTTSATRRVSDAEVPVSGELACGASNGLGFGKDATLREFCKLYGFIKRSGSKKEGVLTVEAANAGDKDA